MTALEECFFIIAALDFDRAVDLHLTGDFHGAFDLDRAGDFLDLSLGPSGIIFHAAGITFIDPSGTPDQLPAADFALQFSCIRFVAT